MNIKHRPKIGQRIGKRIAQSVQNRVKHRFLNKQYFLYQKNISQDAKNRYMYEGKEVDIFIPSMKVGIEYDGRFFHTEGNTGKR